MSLEFKYKVHRGSQHLFTVPATLADGTTVEATVNGFEAELVPTDGPHGTLRLTFPAGSDEAAALFTEGAEVTVAVA